MANIYGIGIDIVEVERLAASIEQFGERFLQRIFTSQETTYCRDKSAPAIHFAARFAAKEAVAKALGTGIGEVVAWTDIEVVRDVKGKPAIQLSDAARRYCDQQHIIDIQISLTHTANYAAANALILCRA
ncbi:MAG: holo-ACP synthase [Verrucomicrobiota bacterium]|jgi:holo-[acyl-carrier protein] synthase